MIGILPGYGTIWYNPKGIANILLSLSVVQKQYQVTYDRGERSQFIMHKDNRTSDASGNQIRVFFTLILVMSTQQF
jgi:hypothetical protein